MDSGNYNCSWKLHVHNTRENHLQLLDMQVSWELCWFLIKLMQNTLLLMDVKGLATVLINDNDLIPY